MVWVDINWSAKLMLKRATGWMFIAMSVMKSLQEALSRCHPKSSHQFLVLHFGVGSIFANTDSSWSERTMRRTSSAMPAITTNQLNIYAKFITFRHPPAIDLIISPTWFRVICFFRARCRCRVQLVGCCCATPNRARRRGRGSYDMGSSTSHITKTHC